MMRYLIGIVLLLLLLVAWQLWPASNSLPPLPAHLATDATDQSATSQVAPTVDASATRSERAAVVAGVAVGEGTSVAVRIRVIDGTTKAVVAGAEVQWWTNASEFEHLTHAQRESARRDPDAFRAARSQHALTDAEGRLQLSLPEATNFCAKHEHRFGSNDWWPKTSPERDLNNPLFPGELVIELAADLTLQVRAVDSFGQPVAEAIAVITQRFESSPGRWGQRSARLPPTDANGIARLVHVQEQLRIGPSHGALSVFAALAGMRGEPMTIDATQLPREPVTIVVPAFGAIRVRLLGPDGQAWRLPAAHEVLCFLSAGAERQRVMGVDYTFFDDHGVAHFPCVRCGQRFEISTPEGFAAIDDIAGPELAGETVEVRLQLDKDTILIAGRVLGADGEPFAKPVEIASAGEDGFGRTWVLPKDGQGRFCVPVPRIVGNQPRITIAPEEQPMDGGLIAVASYRAPLVAGRNELGDLVLEPLPLLLRGRMRVVGEASDANWLDDCHLSVECYLADVEEWQEDRDVRVLLQEDRFVAFGKDPGKRLRVVASGAFLGEPSVEFVAGAEDVELRVALGREVTASFLVDALPVSLDYHLVVADPVDGRRYLAPSKFTTASERVSAKWSHLAAGSYRLVVRCPGLDPLVDVAFVVPESGACNDAALRDIDLRQRARAIRIRLQDGQGRPFLGDASVSVRRGLGEGEVWHLQDFDEQSGGEEAFVIDRPCDFVVLAKGYRAAIAEGVFSDRAITLQPAPRVTLHWVDLDELPVGTDVSLAFGWLEPSRGLEIRRRGRRPYSHLQSSSLLFPSLPSNLVDRRAVWSVETFLPMRVSLLLQLGEPPWEVVPFDLPVIDPLQLQDGQVIELRAEPGEWRAALARLAAKKPASPTSRLR